MDPTFNFTWDNSKKHVSAKVFAKKRQLNKTQEHSNKKVGVNRASDKINTHEVEVNKNVTVKKRIEREQGFIKSKQKKMKQDLKSFSLFNQKPKELYIDTMSGKSVSETVFTITGQTFNDSKEIHKHVLSNLQKHGFVKMTTVQQKAIPVILSGKNVLIRSQTGSGKTLAYAVPVIDALQSITPRIRRQDGVQAIIVVPTRELALQTHEIFNKLNTFQWIVSGLLCGGESRKTEKVGLRKGLHIVIGTPGRLLDHVLHTNAFKINNVRCLVLDEADRLLDMGFRKDIVRLVEEIDKAKTNAEYDPLALLKTAKSESPEHSSQSAEPENEQAQPLRNIHSKERQTILLSATLSEGVIELAEFAMKNHEFIDALDEAQKNTLIIPDTVKQQFIVTYVKHRLFTLSALIVAMSKNNTKVFIFMASTQMVDYHYDLFTRYLINMPKSRGKLKTGNVVLLDAESEMDTDSEEEEEEVVLDMPIFKLHGSMDQKARKEVFTAFRAASKGLLLCTDVAARGIDVPTADCIIQYTGPQTDEDYLHRVGRTGRAGKSGSAIIFLTHEEQDYISRLQEHNVFLKKRNTDDILEHLCELMDEPDGERAATALQRRFENAVAKDKDLYRTACFAYSTWSRFYNSYPAAMRSIFDFKRVNLGHYVTSFAIRDTPSAVAKVVRGEVKSIKKTRLNKKLANHNIPQENTQRKQERKRKSSSLVTSEYASGLEKVKKKKRNKKEDQEDE